MKNSRLIFILFLAFSSVSIVHATDYYVSNTGNDSNTGLSLATAFLTIQKAADVVVAGDNVYVEDGNYAGFDHRGNSGTSANPILFQGLGMSVNITSSGPLRDDGINIEGPDFVIIDGFISNNMPGNGNGVRIVLSNNCIVRNCSCDNNAERGIFTAFTDDVLIEYNVCSNSVDEHGIYVSNSSDRPIIRYNECFGNNNIGIHMNGDLSAGGDGIISDAQVYGNKLYDNNQGAGINMDGLLNPIVYNNLIYNNHSAQGIALFQEDGAIVTRGAKIYNNTIIVPTDGRWGILVKDGANVDTEIYNNIIINQHAWRGCIAIENDSQFESDYNVLNDKMSDDGDGSTISLAAWQLLGFDNHSVLANALNTIFVNPSGNDYHLLAGSQAIDIGTNMVSPTVVVDYDGNARPNGSGYDIGAYEYQTMVPVEYLHVFDAKIVEDHVKLSWSTVAESNNAFYLVERSVDLEHWTKVAKKEAGKESNRAVNYTIWDKKPLQGLSYYRLSQVDLDGTVHYSNNMRSIDFESSFVLVYPNPTKGIFHIKNRQGTIDDVYVYNHLGEIVIFEFGESDLDLSNLPNGIYYLKIKTNNGEVIMESIVKR